MKKLIPLLSTLLLALAALGCSAGADETEVYGEQEQLLCTMPPTATGSSGTACNSVACERAAFSITGIRWGITDHQRFEVYWNGAWRAAVDFDPTSNGGPSIGPTGVHIVGSIGGPGYPPIAKITFQNELFYGGPGTVIKVTSRFNPEMFYNQDIAIHGGWVTCASPPCGIDFNAEHYAGKKFTKMQGLGNAAPGNNGLFRISGFSDAGFVSKDFAIVSTCG